MDLSKNIKGLPDVLKSYILSFHGNPQSRHLIEDIKNYKVSRNRIKEIYDNRWGEFIHIYPQVNDWLDNDLILYLTIKPTMFGYEGKICEIMERKFKCNKNNMVLLKSQNSTNVSNTIWGLMTIEERRNFTEYQE